LPDPTAHAEINVIRTASRALGQERLTGLDLYVTLEPCAQCAGAIANARLARVYYGASDPKSGGVEQGAKVFTHPQTHHKPEVYGGIWVRVFLSETYLARNHGEAAGQRQTVSGAGDLVEAWCFAVWF